MFDPDTQELATSVLAACRARGWHLATAESCTGGPVAAALTAIAGSSEVLDRGFVTYSNEAKMELLGVPATTLAAHGAVSVETTAAMVVGAVMRARVDLAVSITGVAGPGGGSAEKPVGLVYLRIARRDGTGRREGQIADGRVRSERHVFPGDRDEIRRRATIRALELPLAEAR